MTDLRSEKMKAYWADPEWRADVFSKLQAIRDAKKLLPENVQRTQDMCGRYKSGETLQSIADAYGVTRERVRQIISGEGLCRKDGGATVRASIRRKELTAKQQARREAANVYIKTVAGMRTEGRTWVECARALNLRNPSFLISKLRRYIERYGFHEYKCSLFTYEPGSSEALKEIIRGPFARYRASRARAS